MITDDDIKRLRGLLAGRSTMGDLVLAARKWLPALLDEVEQLRKQRDARGNDDC